MKMLKNLIAGVDDVRARAALYYVGRYVKQASHFQEYGKDIFDDERRSSPTEEVKVLALKIIATIEEREGMSAQDFEFDRRLTIIREIAALEGELGAEVTEEDAARAEQFLTEFKLSLPKS